MPHKGNTFFYTNEKKDVKKKKMKILLLGGGGREHAIAWKLIKSPLLEKLYIAPGNAGTAAIGTNINIDVNDFFTIKTFVVTYHIDMLVVGPEAPLVNGITDFFRNTPELKHVKIVGPDKYGAQLEGSKAWAKHFMTRNHIPTAVFFEVSKKNVEEGKSFLKTLNPPYVLKADGLAAGKGVLILENLSDAQKELDSILNGKFGSAGNKVIIEEFLSGIELSVFFATDGTHYLMLPESKDYKRIGENDTGLNTGGMGAISPVPFANTQFMDKVRKQIIEPTILGLKKENINYHGFIFLGLMNVNGNPFVIEYNVRLGDPETEVILPRLKTDLLDILLHMTNDTLDKIMVEFYQDHAATIMLVSKGYPGNYEKGKRITGIKNNKNSTIFHAGTKLEKANVYTNGGRVLAVTSLSNNMDEALAKSYQTIEKINFEGKTFRKDIGQDLKEYVGTR